MKKLILINSLSSGGAEKVVSVILNALADEYSEQIELMCLERNIFYNLDERIKIIYLCDFKGNESGLKRLFYLPIHALRLKKYIKQNNISLIHSNVFRANYVNILAKVFGSKHQSQVVNTGLISFYKNDGFLGKINLFLIKHLYKKADLIICKSRGMLLDLQELFDFKTLSIVINNPYDIEKIQTLAQENVDDFDFKNDKVYWVSMGRFESFKRQETIISALHYLNQKFELILIGDGEKREFSENLSKDIGVKDRVHFWERKLNPFKYLVKSLIYILSSSDGEGFPNVLVDAMICGLTVISTDCKNGLREILATNTDVNYQLKSGI